MREKLQPEVYRTRPIHAEGVWKPCASKNPLANKSRNRSRFWGRTLKQAKQLIRRERLLAQGYAPRPQDYPRKSQESAQTQRKNGLAKPRMQPAFWGGESGLLADVGQDAAVHVEHVAVDEVGSVGGEEHGGALQVIGRAPAGGWGFGNDELIEGMAAAVWLALAQGGRSAAFQCSPARCRCTGCCRRRIRSRCCG